jgi:hypothetical protein
MPTQAAGPIPLALALAKAHGAVSALAFDPQVLAQWANAAAGHGLPYYQERLVYYQGRLAHNKASADVIRVAVQAEADDRLIQTQMRVAMPHRAIMVSLAEQVLRAYQDGRLTMSTYVTTERPALPTVIGHFAIYAKVTPVEFISPWPPGSPDYYPPTWATYWMPIPGADS